MRKSFISSITFIILLATLSACSNDEFSWQKIDKQAIKDAENLSGDAHYSYLQCYPLDQQSKRECVQQLNNQYIIEADYRTNLQYQITFQYKAEKLGFLKFLKNHDLTCSNIDHGPKFIGTENAYKVDCTCGHLYKFVFSMNIVQSSYNVKSKVKRTRLKLIRVV